MPSQFALLCAHLLYVHAHCGSTLKGWCKRLGLLVVCAARRGFFEGLGGFDPFRKVGRGGGGFHLHVRSMIQTIWWRRGADSTTPIREATVSFVGNTQTAAEGADLKSNQGGAPRWPRALGVPRTPPRWLHSLGEGEPLPTWRGNAIAGPRGWAWEGIAQANFIGGSSSLAPCTLTGRHREVARSYSLLLPPH